MQLQEEDHGDAAEAAQGADAAPATEPEADKEEWQQIEVPIEWQPRPMFKVNFVLSLLFLYMAVHGQANKECLPWASEHSSLMTLTWVRGSVVFLFSIPCMAMVM